MGEATSDLPPHLLIISLLPSLLLSSPWTKLWWVCLCKLLFNGKPSLGNFLLCHFHCLGGLPRWIEHHHRPLLGIHPCILKNMAHHCVSSHNPTTIYKVMEASHLELVVSIKRIIDHPATCLLDTPHIHCHISVVVSVNPPTAVASYAVVFKDDHLICMQICHWMQNYYWQITIFNANSWKRLSNTLIVAFSSFIASVIVGSIVTVACPLLTCHDHKYYQHKT